MQGIIYFVWFSEIMIEKVSKCLSENLGVKPSDKILVAVSGGIDSMAMLDVLAKLNFNIAAAHCNFQLRGNESDGDENLVKDVCQQKNIPFHPIHFDTKKYATENGISIQMAARELRYNWFEKLRLQLDIDLIAIAHNANDVVETFFINLSRGTGIKGLTGINAKSRNIIRPLLPFSRAEIKEYVSENNICFCEDTSNSSDKYHRNRIRLNIIPEFQKINPSFLATMLENIDRMGEVSKFVENEIDIKAQKLISKNDDSLEIDIDGLQKENQPSLILFEILQDYGFNISQVENIIDALNNQPGQEFYSASHRLVKDRSALILIKKREQVEKKSRQIFEIQKGTDQIKNPISLKFEIFEKGSDFKLTVKENIAEFDADRFSFPLRLRKWELGDFFYPLGMKNKKKISDYFVDNRFSLVDKEKTWLLISGDDIVWIVGHRIDNRFKITGNTKNILRIRLS